MYLYKLTELIMHPRNSVRTPAFRVFSLAVICAATESAPQSVLRYLFIEKMTMHMFLHKSTGFKQAACSVRCLSIW